MRRNWLIAKNWLMGAFVLVGAWYVLWYVIRGVAGAVWHLTH